MNKIYHGRRLQPAKGTVSDIEVSVTDANGKRTLQLEPSLKLRNHSPTGFNWGYGGSGPAQLALGILLEDIGYPEIAQRYYQDFKRHFVAGWGDTWTITTEEIQDFISA